MRVGVYAIALNEDDNVRGWLDAIGDQADHVLVADTGSTDPTRARLSARGVAVHDIAIRPFRFDGAWNAALALMPADLDVVVACSLDIRLPPDWRATLEREWPTAVGDRPVALQPWFEVNGMTWRHSFIHSRHGLHYRFPFHELLLPQRGEVLTAPSSMTFTHPDHGSRQTDPERNLELLRMAIAESPHELRHQHYYGRELMYAGRWNEAIPVLTGHATSTAWAPDRSESWVYVGDCMKESMPTVEVPTGPYRMATIVSPDRREGWVKLAELCRLQAKWSECLDAAEHALAITTKHRHFNWPWAWGTEPADCAALACLFLGRYEDAILYGKQALELEPDNERLKVNLADYERHAAAMSA